VLRPPRHPGAPSRAVAGSLLLASRGPDAPRLAAEALSDRAAGAAAAAADASSSGAAAAAARLRPGRSAAAGAPQVPEQHELNEVHPHNSYDCLAAFRSLSLSLPGSDHTTWKRDWGPRSNQATP
jgi:hypothetical protein